MRTPTPDMLMFETYPTQERAGGIRLQQLLRPFVRLDIVHAPQLQPDQDFRRVEQWRDHARYELDARGVTAPFWLIGHSYGGIVALETARSLVAAGHRVAYVAMIDTWRPELHPRTMAEKAAFVASEWGNRIPGGRVPFVVDQIKASARYRSRQISTLGNRLFSRALLLVQPDSRRPTPESGAAESEAEAMLRAVQVSWLHYNAKTATFPVTLFWCRRSLDHWGGDPSLGWSPYLRGGFDQYPVAGDHLSLMSEEHIDSLASAIMCSVRRASLTPELTKLGRDAGGC